MIPRRGAARRSAERALYVAFALSLLIHMGGGALYGFLANKLPRLRLIQRPKPSEVFVTLSDSMTFDKRPRPVPRARASARLSQPQPVPEAPVLPARQPRRKELESRLESRKEVALAEPRRERAAQSVTMTQREIARFNQDMVAAITAARGANDPLRVTVRQTPAAPKRYRLQFEGRITDLRSGQGILTPIKKWFADGYDYYYVTYEVVWEDGTYESGAVPWPIRYRPEEDPFLSGVPKRIPLPPPLPGWTLPEGIHLGKVLRAYFPNRSFAE